MKRGLEERLREHPELRERFEKMLDIVENADGDCVLADDAELRVLEQVRGLGRELLQGWAEEGAERSSVPGTIARTSVGRKKNSEVADPVRRD